LPIASRTRYRRNGKTYANVGAIVPLPKGMPVPKQFNESVCFEVGTSSDEEFEALPQFIKDKIAKSVSNKNLNINDEERDLINAARNAHNKIGCRIITI